MADFELNKEVSEFLGLKGDNLDDFKTNFEDTFIRKDKIGDDKTLLAPHFAKTTGEIETKLRSAARAYGIEIEEGLIPKGSKVTEVVDILFGKATEIRKKEVEELNGKINTPDDKALEKLQGDYDTFKESQGKKYKDIEGLRDDAVTKFNELETSTNEQFKNIKLDTLRGEAHGKIKWAKEGQDFDLKYKGFQAQMNENFKTSLNEEGSFIVTDKDGERIKDDKITGQFKSYDSVLKDEAEKAGLLKVNPNGGQKVPNFTPPPPNGTPPVEGQVTRKINTATR